MSRSTNRAQAWLGCMVLVLTCASMAAAQVPRDRVFSANQTTGTVTAFDTDKGGVQYRVPDTGLYPALSTPTEVALNPMLKAGYATEQTAASLAVFDPIGDFAAGGQIKTRIPLSITQPFGVAVTPDGRLAFVGNAARASGVGGPTQDMISVVDCEREVEIGTIDVSVLGALGPIDVACSPDGAFVYVACVGDLALAGNPRFVAVIDVATLAPLFAVLMPTTDVPFQIAVTPDNAFVYIACLEFDGSGTGEVAFFDVPTLTTGLVAGLTAGANPTDVFTNRASSIVYVCDNANALVNVVSIAAQTVITNVISFGGGAQLDGASRGCVNEADEFAYVSDGTDVTQFSMATNVATVVFPADAGPTGVAATALAQLDAVGAANVQRVRERREDQKKGLCFVATASFGQTDEVASLRAFRDLYLMPTKFGRAFVDFYYESSPGVASVISSREGVRASVRDGLAPVVWAARLVMHSGYGLLGGVAVLLALAAGAVAARRLLVRA